MAESSDASAYLEDLSDELVSICTSHEEPRHISDRCAETVKTFAGQLLRREDFMLTDELCPQALSKFPALKEIWAAIAPRPHLLKRVERFYHQFGEEKIHFIIFRLCRTSVWILETKRKERQKPTPAKVQPGFRERKF